MPLTKKGKKIKKAMTKQYGPKKGEAVFYASINKGKIKGVEKASVGLYAASKALKNSENVRKVAKTGKFGLPGMFGAEYYSRNTGSPKEGEKLFRELNAEEKIMEDVTRGSRKKPKKVGSTFGLSGFGS